MSDKKDFFGAEVIDIDTKKGFQSMMNKGKNMGLAIIIGIILIFGVLTSIYKVDSGYVAVVMRFGKVHKEVRAEGIHLKVPYIDTVKMVNTEYRHKLEYGFATVQGGTERQDPVYKDMTNEATVIVGAKDNNSSIVLINLIVRYKVDNPVDYLFRVDDLDGTLKLALEDVLRNTIQTFSLNEALTNKAAIDSDVLMELRNKMKQYHAGILIEEVKTQNVELLPAVNEAYEQVEKANQYKNGKLEESQKYRNTVIPQAEAEAIKLIEDAKGYSAEVIAGAKASVAEFEALYAEYQKNPHIVKERYYIDSMNEFIRNNKIIMDATGEGQIHKFFNMDESKNSVKQDIVN